MEVENYKKKSDLDSLFSKPPPVSPLIGHSLNIPPPRLAKNVEQQPPPPAMQNQLSDLEKQVRIYKHFKSVEF